MYDQWRRSFYPPELTQRRWFEYSTRHFNSLEINSTFYRLPSTATFDRWRDQAPAGFVCAIKYSRYGSHMKRLRDPKAHLDPFVEHATRLGACLGPILVQLPPRWRLNLERLQRFLDTIPPGSGSPLAI